MKKNEYLKVNELKPYHTYRIRARNGRVGVWCPEKGEFLLSRFKFGDNFPFGEIHYDLSSHFGTAKPLEELEKSPFIAEDFDVHGDYKHNELLDYLNNWEDKMEDPHPRSRVC